MLKLYLVLFSIHSETIRVHVNVPRMCQESQERPTDRDQESTVSGCHLLLEELGRVDDLSPSGVRASHHVAGPQRHTRTQTYQEKHTSKQK